ncbi:hypothetical protein [Nocardioides pantholopis]|uniref:hypothetical protein n=1 Tax=Nocardioides pantholopis TaxID=2483798 RepID=UPI0013DE00C9|nr:hypothetical protein [Nocardioides pantholopis]
MALTLRRRVPELWAAVLAVLLLGPALAPGYVLSYDMVWVPDLALRPGFLGLGSGLPRAVPSDLVVALADEIVPGMMLQKLVLLGALVGAGIGASRLAPAGLVPRLVAVTVYVWNPFVVERLVIGHWPVLVGYAVLPWVIEAGTAWRRGGRLPLRLLWLVPLGGLSAGAGLVTAVVLLAFAAGGRRTLPAVLLAAAGNAPWLVAGLLHASTATTDAAGASVFALHDQGWLPGPVAALGLGGIWNSEVVPGSGGGTAAALGVVVLLVLAGIGARGWWRRHDGRERAAYLGCWSAGWLLAVLTWLSPDAVGWLVATVPGAGLVRDGARLLALCAPLLAVAAADGAATLWRHRPGAAVPRAALGLALVLAPVAALPAAAWGASSSLRAVSFPDTWAAARQVVSGSVDRQPGDVLLLPLSSYRQPGWNGGVKVLDPLGRYLTPDYVAGDELVVSGTVVAGEDPRAGAAGEALALPTARERSARLAELGIRVVVVDREAPGTAPPLEARTLWESPDLQVLELADPARRDLPASWTVAMALALLAWGSPLVVALAGWLVRSRRLRSRVTQPAGRGRAGRKAC